MTNPLDQLKRVGWVGWLAVVVAILALVVCLPGLVGVGGSLLAPSARRSAAAQEERLAKAAEDYATGVERSLAQIDGRSIFFVPSPPIPPPPPPPTVVETEPPPPPKPTSYGGPAIIAMVNDAVWFSDGTRLVPGQSSESGEVRVVRVEMPWQAVLEWKGVEFKVPLFDRDSTVIKEPAPPPADAPPTLDPTLPTRSQEN
ncbi:MAG: hypothetical protein FJ255_08190 [Phycisphaerae bacterium]|nr:hypothetical protein [Phycisphaerae bacterium]